MPEMKTSTIAKRQHTTQRSLTIHTLET